MLSIALHSGSANRRKGHAEMGISSIIQFIKPQSAQKTVSG